ncbi:DUF302 domain-containing protein [Skermania piniformis]|uniref:DUF302 domain-containing protein n=1 Tax=Skermania pinensis TaxID=39122 RepID=A0ABX8S7Z8_9ACTN|nr:DUF302 domain-containing protein [Skermania piniformis]QXQ12630.1 DUF302 domain-containing protein [Skermania piniformis]
MSDLAIATSLRTTIADAAERTRAALQREGFGILTEIDLSHTLHQKIGAEVEPYLILGACNPPLAFAAVTAERQVGLLLPCNVVVRQDPADPGLVHVEAMNPQLMVEVTDNAELRPVAADAAARLGAAVERLTAELPTADPGTTGVAP